MLTARYLNRLIHEPGSPLAHTTISPADLQYLASVKEILFTSLAFFYEGPFQLGQYFAVEDQTFASKQYILQVAASVAAQSKILPLEALSRAAKESGIPVREMEIDPIGEGGLTGKLENTWYLLGDEATMQEEGISLGVTSRALTSQLEKEGGFIFFLAQRRPKRLLGIFSCKQNLSQEAAQVVADIMSQDIAVQIITSRSAGNGAAIQEQLGIAAIQTELDEKQKKAYQKTFSGLSVGVGKRPGSFLLSSGAKESFLELNHLSELPLVVQFAQSRVEKARKLFFWSKL